jgi:hypothetical protein
LIDQMRQSSLDQRGVAWIKEDGSRKWFTTADAIDLPHYGAR